eukprot:1937414-Heterocapsa_arctica.AAC.1
MNARRMLSRGTLKEVPPPRPQLCRPEWEAHIRIMALRKRYRTRRPTAIQEEPAAAGLRMITRREATFSCPRWELSSSTTRAPQASETRWG